MIYLVTALLLAICLVFQSLIFKKKGFSGLFNNPFSLLIIFYELIHLVMPLLQWHHSYFRYSSNYDEFIYTFSIIFTFFLFLSYSFIFLYKIDFFLINSKKITLSKGNAKKFYLIAILVFFIGFYFSFKNIIQIQSIGVDMYLKDRIGFSAGSGYKILFSHWVYISCILFFLGYLFTEKSKLYFYSFLLNLIYCFVYYGMNSNRNSLFILAFVLFVSYISFSNVARQNYSFYIKGFLSVFLLAFSFYSIGKFRSTVNSNENHNYGLVNSLNGAFGNHENIVWLLSNNYEVLLGNTYVASFLNIVPRALWPNKPFGAGPELKNMIYPGSYVLGQEGNSSLTTGLMTEIIMNFGVLGSFPAIFFLSLIIYSFLVYLKKLNHTIGLVIYIYIFTLLSTQFLYAEFLGFYTRTLFTGIPIIMLAFFVKFERKAL